MTLTVGAPVAANLFAVSTVSCDATRAALQISGQLEADAASILTMVADGHLRAGRRYLRVDVSNLTSVDDAALDVFSEVHRELLSCRGTLIFTGVTRTMEQTLTRASAALFLIAPTAADLITTAAIDGSSSPQLGVRHLAADAALSRRGQHAIGSARRNAIVADT